MRISDWSSDVNPINLLALALLSTPKHAMGEGDLRAQILLSKRMLEEVPYSALVTVTPHSPEEIIAHGEKIGVLLRTAHPLGDALSEIGRASCRKQGCQYVAIMVGGIS